MFRSSPCVCELRRTSEGEDRAHYQMAPAFSMGQSPSLLREIHIYLAIGEIYDLPI